jgi:hypothetical protein
LLRTIQRPIFAILLVLLSQVRTIDLLFTVVPAVIVSVRLVVHVEAHAGSTPYRTSQGHHEDERSELCVHVSLLFAKYLSRLPTSGPILVDVREALFADKVHRSSFASAYAVPDHTSRRELEPSPDLSWMRIH